MKRLTSSLLAIFVAFFVFAPQAQAKVMMQEKGVVTIGADQVIDDDLFVAGESVDLKGVVDGDVYIGAGSVTVSGKITGDLVVGAGNLVVIGATIGDTLIVGAGQVTIDDSSTIGGSLLAGTGTLYNRAPVGRNLMVGAGELNLDAPVAGEARVGAGSITLGDATKIGGDLYYGLESGQELSIASTATVAGMTHRIEPKGNWDREQARRDFMAAGRAAKTGMAILSYLSLLLVGLLSLRLLPKFNKQVTMLVKEQTLKSLGIGFLAIVVVLPATLILLITVLGAPLAFVSLLVFLLNLYFSKVVVAQALGNYLAGKMSKKWTIYFSYFVGLTVFAVLRMIPVVGGLVSFVFTLTGLGAILLYQSSLLGK